MGPNDAGNDEPEHAARSANLQCVVDTQPLDEIRHPCQRGADTPTSDTEPTSKPARGSSPKILAIPMPSMFCSTIKVADNASHRR